MPTKQDLEILDWEIDFQKIIEQIQSNSKPFKIQSFFNNTPSIPKTHDEYQAILGHLPLRLTKFIQAELLNDIKNNQITYGVKAASTVSDFYESNGQSQSPLKNFKCFEDLIPLVFVNDLTPKLTADKIKPFLKNEFGPNFYYRFFYGFKGDETEPHFDWTSYNSILFQIFGEKEIHLFSHDIFNELPLISNYVDLSTQELLNFAKAKQIPYQTIVLRPLEGLYIPPLYVHAVTYLSHSSSVSLRLLPYKSHAPIFPKLPATACLAQVLGSRPMQPKAVENLMHQVNTKKNYLEIVNSCQEYAGASLNQRFEHSFRFEEYLFGQLQSFEKQLALKKIKVELLDRGAAHFDHL